MVIRSAHVPNRCVRPVCKMLGLSLGISMPISTVVPLLWQETADLRRTQGTRCERSEAPREASVREGTRSRSDALRRLYACDKIIVGEFMWLVRLASEPRATWRDAAAPRVHWRDRRERGHSRGIMCVIVRAWRELTDGVRAGTVR